jgi:hypothetical protein
MESKPPQVRPLALPIGFSLALAAFALLGPVRSNPTLLWTFLVTAGLLLGWAVALLVASLAKGRRLSFDVVLSKQHYVQACAHTAIFLYWGWYFREVYGYAYLILAQLVFAYAFDSLLSWSRRDNYTVGFGPFPIIFSTNLFLWFRTDWFYWQFVTVAIGFVAKELFKWQKGDRRAHIFNPSSFPLALLSLILLATGTSGLTWGREIATLAVLSAPHVPLPVLDHAARPVPVRRDLDDAGGGGHDLPVRARLPGADRDLLLLRLVHSHRGLPGHAPALHRSLDGAAERAGAGDLRRALRHQRDRPLPAPRFGGPAELRGQAAGGAALEPLDQAHRPARGLEALAMARSGPARAHAHGPAPQPRLHDGLGSGVRR